MIEIILEQPRPFLALNKDLFVSLFPRNKWKSNSLIRVGISGKSPRWKGET